MTIATLARSTVLLLAAAAALPAGCKATNTVSSGRPVDPNVVNMNYKVANDELAGQLVVKSAYEKQVNGLTSVQINIRNEGAGDLWFMWQVRWTDRNGMTIVGTNQTWTRQVLAERQEGVIEFVAPTTDSYDWRVTLQKWERGS